MRTVYLLAIFVLLTSKVNSELIKPNVTIEPYKVIQIQLSALQNNDIPYKNAGIEQTWEFAHPSNRMFTGPLKRFTDMMYSPSYFIMLNHQKHEIVEVKLEDKMSYYFIELTDISGNKYGFQWILEKVLNESIYNNCWMTTSVSKPMPLAKSS